MTRLSVLLPIAFLAAAPAHATGGLVCRTAGPQPIEVSLVIGHTAVSSVVSARLTDGGRQVLVRAAQSWLDPDEIRLDLVDPQAIVHELRLRAVKKGDAYDGSLWRGGKLRWVRCREA
ncbi:MAG TPA: hypothetical protein VFP53_06430 [Sphingomicrobium sp.]|nr:hypothetical protein [Sphingomicrobium sp.]